MTSTEISEAKIRNAIWYIKTGKTKKFVCDYLNIPYSPKKLDSIIADFQKRAERESELKQRAKTKVFSATEIQQIAKQYLEGASQASLAKENFISTAKLKKLLIEAGTPIRSRGSKKQTQVSHIQQDFDSKLTVGSKVFFTVNSCFGTITKVYDEEYLNYLEGGRQRFVETYPFRPNPKTGLSGKYSEPTEGIHYEIYYSFSDGVEMKKSAVVALRSRILKNLEQTGREMYEIWRTDEFSCFYFAHRNHLYPVKV